MMKKCFMSGGLPLPSLEQTLDRYLESLRPLIISSPDLVDLSPDDHIGLIKTHIQQFLTGDGPLLQQQLLDKATRENEQGRSWLIDWWNAWAYWESRVSLCFYVNYCFGFRDHPHTSDQTMRAALLVDAFFKVRQQLNEGKFEPDKVRSTPICMKQFDHLFNVCRYPLLCKDTTVNHGQEGNGHVAVVYRGRFYTFHVTTDKERLSIPDIKAQLDRIISIGSGEEDEWWGALTVQDRDQWTRHRQWIIEADPTNSVQLHRLETAAFLLCLDTNSPVTDAEFSRSCWHAIHPSNRYFDKSIQVLVFANGRAGMNGEHSMSDGTATGRICLDAVKLTEGYTQQDIQTFQRQAAHTTLAPPTKIDLILTPAIHQAIQGALAYHKKEVDAHDVFVLRYKGYGKNRMKKFKLSPDAYVQMSFQLAYYRMYGTLCATYESASTRKFTWGRTETCRSLSMDALLWVQSMRPPKNGQRQLGYAERAELLRRAIGTHSRNTVLATEGQGIDRHLLGLYLQAQESNLPPPDLFKDAIYSVSKHWTLSTSQVSDPVFTAYAWGEVVSDGYGLAYMVLENEIQVNVCSKGRNSSELGRWIEMSLVEMRALLEGAEKERQGREEEIELEVERWLSSDKNIKKADDSSYDRVEIEFNDQAGCAIS
jgi:carnitine O-acetyltransferase